MTAFLSWLLGVASKVYDWFGNAYYSLRNAASNAWNWAVSQAQNAISTAQAYALSLLHQINVTINNVILLFESKLGDIRQGFIDDINAVYSWVDYRLAQIGSISTQWIIDAINSVRDFIQFNIDVINNTVQSIQENILTYVSSWISWLFEIRDQLINLINIFNPSFLAKIIDFFSRTITGMYLFFDNPVVFILDIIQAYFIAFLCYVVAWALGTTKYDLPVNPPWKD